MKRILPGLILVVAAIIGGGLYFKRNDIALAVFQHAAEQGLSADAIAGLPDGLSAAFCGTGSPLPDRERAGPCTAVIAGRHLYVFDSGDGAPETLSLMGLLPGKVEAVFLTHFHSDHIDALGELALQRWGTSAARTPLPLYGGEGVERVAAGFNEAYALDSLYRTAHHGAAVMPPGGFGLSAHAFTIPDGRDSVVVLESDGVRIMAFRVDHGPVHPAVGYRIDYHGRSIVISGDTAPAASLERAAENADLLIHEGLSPRLVNIMEAIERRRGDAALAKIFHDILGYHTDPQDAAAIAARAHVHALVFTHVIPPIPNPILEGPYLGQARLRYNGPLFIARDGDLITLPAAGGMTRRNILR